MYLNHLNLIGYGFVGKAVYNFLKDKHTINIVDPHYNDNILHYNTDGYIVCVPTPTDDNDGSCDMSTVYDVLKTIPEQSNVLIKRTISLEGWKYIKNKFDELKIAFSPEFLTAVNASEDLDNEKNILLGGTSLEFWYNVFNQCKPKDAQLANIEELILAKYARNSFLATKVTFFNELYDLCQETEIDYDTVKELVGMDDRISIGHTQVPGPDGKRGFGGACFPKDTLALKATYEANGVESYLLNKVIDINYKMREK